MRTNKKENILPFSNLTVNSKIYRIEFSMDLSTEKLKAYTRDIFIYFIHSCI